MVLTATAGVAMAAGLLCIVAGDAFGEALDQLYRWGDPAETGPVLTALATKRRRAEYLAAVTGLDFPCPLTP
jgi:hypothetical protein